MSKDSNMLLKWATGSITFNWSWPPSAAKETVLSLPRTLAKLGLLLQVTTGFTCSRHDWRTRYSPGRFSLLKPVRGPEERRRKSLQILDSLTARRCVLRVITYALNSQTRCFIKIFSGCHTSRPVTSKQVFHCGLATRRRVSWPRYR